MEKMDSYQKKNKAFPDFKPERLLQKIEDELSKQDQVR